MNTKYSIIQLFPFSCFVFDFFQKNSPNHLWILNNFKSKIRKREFLPKSMSNIAAFAPSTRTCFPCFICVCKNEMVSVTMGLSLSAKTLYLSNSASLSTFNDLNLEW